MLSYLYVLKVSAVCGLAPLAFLSVTAVGFKYRLLILFGGCASHPLRFSCI